MNLRHRSHSRMLLALVAMLLTSVLLLSACGAGAPADTPPADTPPADTPAVTTDTGDTNVPVDTQDFDEIRILAMGTGSHLNDLRDTRTHQAMIQATRVIPFFEEVDDDRFNVLLAAGDLPDLISLMRGTTGLQREGLVRGGHLTALCDYIPQEWWDNEMIATALRISREFYSFGTGRIYFIPLGFGQNTATPGYYFGLRWDLYRELGFPEFSNPFEFIDVMAQMVELEPYTDEGEPTFGMAMFDFWGENAMMFGVWGYYWGNWHGLFTIGEYNMVDREIRVAMEDRETSGFWNSVRVFNYAHRLGILDPDSLVHTWDTRRPANAGGQYMFSWADWARGAFHHENANANPPRGHVGVPYVGGNVFATTGEFNYLGGFMWAVGANANVEAVMRYITFLSSYDGMATMLNGVEGIDWVVGPDGRPMFTEYNMAIRTGEGGTAALMQEGGIGYSGNYMMFSFSTIHPRLNVPLQFTLDPQIAAMAETALEADFAAHFGVYSATQVLNQAIADGQMRDFSELNTLAISLLPSTPPIEIQRQITNLDNLMGVWGARLVLANSEAEFESLKEQALADFNRNGMAEVTAWMQGVWAEAVEATTRVFN